MEPILITDTLVLKELTSLKLNKSASPDSIHPCILHECHTVLCQPLSPLFKLSLNLSRLPLDWKTAHIIPTFKKVRKDLAENYRPISMTSAVVKVLERIIQFCSCKTTFKQIMFYTVHNMAFVHKDLFTQISLNYMITSPSCLIWGCLLT